MVRKCAPHNVNICIFCSVFFSGSNVIIGVTVKDIHDNSSVNKIILRSDKNEIVKEFDLGNTYNNVVHVKLFIPPQVNILHIINENILNTV